MSLQPPPEPSTTPPGPSSDAGSNCGSDDSPIKARKENQWFFDKARLENTPSRRAGVDANKELAYRQQAATFIQDMGQKLQVNQLCINTAIVYMHRFYMFHSFTQFHRNAISTASIFLAAKVEEQPRKLDHVIKVAHYILNRNEPANSIDPRSESYQRQSQELVMNENILLQTLGFDVAVDHPHTHVVKCCQLVRASKDLGQTSYFMATNSLHLTTMCLQYRPTLVACVCIHLACKWSSWEIPRSKEGKDWWKYVDEQCTEKELEALTAEYLDVFNKSPCRLKKRIVSMNNAGNLSIQTFPVYGSVSSASRTDNAVSSSATSSTSGNVRSRSRSPSPKRQRVSKPGEGSGVHHGLLKVPGHPSTSSHHPTKHPHPPSHGHNHVVGPHGAKIDPHSSSKPIPPHGSVSSKSTGVSSKDYHMNPKVGNKDHHASASHHPAPASSGSQGHGKMPYLPHSSSTGRQNLHAQTHHSHISSQQMHPNQKHNVSTSAPNNHSAMPGSHSYYGTGSGNLVKAPSRSATANYGSTNHHSGSNPTSNASQNPNTSHLGLSTSIPSSHHATSAAPSNASLLVTSKSSVPATEAVVAKPAQPPSRPPTTTTSSAQANSYGLNASLHHSNSGNPPHNFRSSSSMQPPKPNQPPMTSASKPFTQPQPEQSSSRQPASSLPVFNAKSANSFDTIKQEIKSEPNSPDNGEGLTVSMSAGSGVVVQDKEYTSLLDMEVKKEAHGKHKKKKKEKHKDKDKERHKEEKKHKKDKHKDKDRDKEKSKKRKKEASPATPPSSEEGPPFSLKLVIKKDKSSAVSSNIRS